MAHTPNNPDEPTTARADGYVLPRGNYNVSPSARGDNAAADVIRQKLEKIYASEPDAAAEEKEAEAVKHRSKHQQYMYDLNHSGKDLAQIQTEWHVYYLSLSDADKHAVWQEFYANNQAAQTGKLHLPADTPTEAEKLAHMRNQMASHSGPVVSKHHDDDRDAATIQKQVKKHAVRTPKSKAKQHLHSVLFGLGVGATVVFIFLFGFFNEVIIAPFIQPARTQAATPLIVSSDTVAATTEPQVIIPKINVQIPVNFNQTSTDETAIENDLESGIVHYPTTSSPGENGNSAYFGHSSNNIFNKGKYKFAFVLLHELVPGDTFYITKNSKVYAYKVFSKTVVDPSEVGVLNPVAGHQATATLITCDPPGTSLRRLVVVGDQISPDVNGNGAATNRAVTASDSADQLVGNGQTLFGRFIGSSAGKAVVVVLALAIIMLFFRLTNPKRKY